MWLTRVQEDEAAVEKSGDEASEDESPNKDIEGRRLWVLEQVYEC